MRTMILAILPAIMAISASAEACRINRPPAQRLSDGRKSGAISAVAIVKITQAAYIQESDGDAHPWAASASIEQVVEGHYPFKTVRFERGWGSAACDDGLPPPKVGERWRVYFWKRTAADQQVWQTYPEAVAGAADPLLVSPR